MSTNALAAKKALKAIVDGVPDLAQIQRSFSWPNAELEKRWIMVDRVEWDESEWATNRGRQEIFSITVVANVQINGGTAEQAEEAACALMDGIEDAVKANPRLGIPSVVSTDFIPKKLDSWPLPEGFEGQFEASVEVTARL